MFELHHMRTGNVRVHSMHPNERPALRLLCTTVRDWILRENSVHPVHIAILPAVQPVLREVRCRAVHLLQRRGLRHVQYLPGRLVYLKTLWRRQHRSHVLAVQRCMPRRLVPEPGLFSGKRSGVLKLLGGRLPGGFVSDPDLLCNFRPRLLDVPRLRSRLIRDRTVHANVGPCLRPVQQLDTMRCRLVSKRAVLG